MDRRGAFFIYCGDPKYIFPKNPEGYGLAALFYAE